MPNYEGDSSGVRPFRLIVRRCHHCFALVNNYYIYPQHPLVRSTFSFLVFSVFPLSFLLFSTSPRHLQTSTLVLLFLPLPLHSYPITSSLIFSPIYSPVPSPLPSSIIPLIFTTTNPPYLQPQKINIDTPSLDWINVLRLLSFLCAQVRKSFLSFNFVLFPRISFFSLVSLSLLYLASCACLSVCVSACLRVCPLHFNPPVLLFLCTLFCTPAH